MSGQRTDGNGQTFEVFWGRRCLVTPDRYYQNTLSLGGNIFFTILFANLLQPLLYLIFTHRTYTSSILIFLGTLGECLTYIARTVLSLDETNGRFSHMAFIVAQITPILLSAGIFQVLARLTVVFDGDALAGSKSARWMPRTYTLLFTGWSAIVFILQAVAMGMIAVPLPGYSYNYGARNLNFAANVLHLVSIFLFVACAAELAVRWWGKSKQGKLNSKYAGLYNSMKFKVVVGALTLSTTTLLIRTIYRVTLDAQSFAPIRRIHSPSIYKDTTYMVLEGAMMAIACLALTVGHPGLALAGVWKEADVWVSKGKELEREGGGAAVDSGDLGANKEVGKKEDSSFESRREVAMSGAK